MGPRRDIQERTFQFALSITAFCRRLNLAHPVTRRLAWQLLDSATSTGANMEEADGGQSRRDFIAKVALAKKEAKESVFWLRLIAASDKACAGDVAPLLAEANQIASIISTIKRHAQQNMEQSG